MEKKSRKTKFGMNDRQAEIKTKASFPFHKQRTSTNKKKTCKKVARQYRRIVSNHQ